MVTIFYTARPVISLKLMKRGLRQVKETLNEIVLLDLGCDSLLELTTETERHDYMYVKTIFNFEHCVLNLTCL